MAVNTDRIYLVLVPTIRPLVAAATRKRLRGFTADARTDARVLFLGDSITQGVEWSELFPELWTQNRGINGDTTEDVLARLDEALQNPIAVSLLIGTNDLHTHRRLKDPDGIVSRVEQIIDRIKTAAPHAQIFVNSITPRTPLFAPRIRALNARYSDLVRNAHQRAQELTHRGYLWGDKLLDRFIDEDAMSERHAKFEAEFNAEFPDFTRNDFGKAVSYGMYQAM